MLNQHKIIMVDCYVDTDVAGLWGHKITQNPICDRIRTVFAVYFNNFTLLWVSKLQTEIYISTLSSEYVAIYNYVRYLLFLNSLIKEVIDSFVIDSDKLNFVSSSTVYGEIMVP